MPKEPDFEILPEEQKVEELPKPPQPVTFQMILLRDVRYKKHTYQTGEIIGEIRSLIGMPAEQLIGTVGRATKCIVKEGDD